MHHPLHPAADLAQSALRIPLATRSATLIPPRWPGRGRARRHMAASSDMPLFATLSGALAFSLLTDGGRQTRNVASLLPSKDQVFSWLGLRIDQVALKGQRFTSDGDVFDAIDLPNVGSLLSLDSSGMRNRIEELPWVGSAVVSRVYPGTIDVHITERKPTALWRKGGQDYLIDDSGRTLSVVAAGRAAAAAAACLRRWRAGTGQGADRSACCAFRRSPIVSNWPSASAVGAGRCVSKTVSRCIWRQDAKRRRSPRSRLIGDLGKLLDRSRPDHRLANARSHHCAAARPRVRARPPAADKARRGGTMIVRERSDKGASEIVGLLDIGTSKVACLIAAIDVRSGIRRCGLARGFLASATCARGASKAASSSISPKRRPPSALRSLRPNGQRA